MPEALWVRDSAGRVLLANRASEILWGRSRDELCAHPEVIDALGAEGGDHRIALPTGETRWIHIRTSELPAAAGGSLQLCIAQDITDYHKLVDELRESESAYRQLIETQEQMIVKVDPEGRLLYVSPSYCEMFGRQEHELLGCVFMPLVHEEDRASTMKAMERLLEPPHICYLEQRAMTRHGWRWLSWNDKAAVNERGEIVYIVGAGRDITERRRHREELARAMSDAERANREKDSFLAMLSHELRTPLTPVLASVSAVEHEDNLSPELRDTLQMIRRNIELESRLIDDLLDLTRISRGKLQLDPHLVDAQELLQTAIRISWPDVEGKGIRFTRELVAAETKIFADPARIQQVYWNVIKNAVRFTQPGGHIQVRSSNQPGLFVVQVIDDGAGIDPDFLPRIFDAFEQEHRGQRGGLGLGLAISRTVLDLHGGTMMAESEGAHRGSRFTIQIPLADRQDQLEPAAVAIADTEERRNLRVLLVEDHASTLQVLSRLLTKMGHQVTTAMTLEEAIRLVAEGSFDLLISDIGLPDGSGLDLMRRVREYHPIPGIALSGFGMEQDISNSRQAGFQAHLTKPVGMDLLLRTINEVRQAQH